MTKTHQWYQSRDWFLLYWCLACSLLLQNQNFGFLTAELGESIWVLGEFERQKEGISGFLAVLLMDTCLICFRSLKSDFIHIYEYILD